MSAVKDMTDQKKESTAIATRSGELPRVITTPDEYTNYLRVKRDERCHLLTPATDIGALPPQWALVPSAVSLNSEPEAGDVYRDPLFCEGDEVALAKVGLLKIARAAGISLTTERLDSGHVPYYWSFKATASYRGLDGQIKTLEGTAEYDLRDGSPRINKMIQAAKRKNRDATSQIEGARMHGLRGCEARACNAAIRQFGLRQKYTKAEAAKPFVVFNLVFQPDMNDPTQRAAVVQAALGATSALYGGATLPPAPAAPTSHAQGDIIDADPVKPSRADAEPDAVPFELEKRPAAEKEPEYFVTGVFKRKAGGFYVTTRETGDEQWRTDDVKVATAAKEANEAAVMVHITFEKRGDERWIVSLSEVEKL